MIKTIITNSEILRSEYNWYLVKINCRISSDEYRSYSSDEIRRMRVSQSRWRGDGFEEVEVKHFIEA